MDYRIRYIAGIADDPAKLAEYYTTYYGLRELGRSVEGDVSLTDGFYNLTFLKRRPGLDEEDDRPGLNRFGIEIDDIREIESRLEEFAPRAEIRQEKGDLHHGDFRIYDPNDIPISLSLRSFGVSGEERQMPQIRHIAMMVPKNQEVADFFCSVFGFRETSSGKKNHGTSSPVRFVGDGSTALAILRDPARAVADGVEPPGTNLKPGVNHFGFLVESLDDMLNRLLGPQTSRRPATRPMAEFRTHDPEGNPIDISQIKGYEVDDEVWVRGPQPV
ncbi:MAG TPA: VOC family protein [Chloroflexota bacterium]|jgi:catechol 2,3-dioxygenase-like lactoylglutathione lyase family enzyme|nr:VOC family protein [Chloroflexota bacterium]